jgi:hypothetical protein
MKTTIIDLRPSFGSIVAGLDSAAVASLRRDCLGAPMAGSLLNTGSRARSAEKLAHLAFVERDRRAWEAVQAVVWQLMRREKFRPVSPADVEVLDILFRAEGASIRTPAVSSSLSIDEFCDQMDRDLAAIVSQKRFDDSVLDGFEAEDWQFVLCNLAPSGWDFARIIALTAVMLPIELAVPLYENLYDESGRGGRQTPHRTLFQRMMEALGAPVPNLDRHELTKVWYLDRVVPEAIAELNLWYRMLWSRHPGGSIGAMYSIEASVPSYFAQLERQLRRMGLGDTALEYIKGHQETDVEHAGQWRELVKVLLADSPDERAAIYQGALLSASWEVAAWQTIIQVWHDWKAGKPISNIGASLDPMTPDWDALRHDAGAHPALVDTAYA